MSQMLVIRKCCKGLNAEGVMDAAMTGILQSLRDSEAVGDTVNAGMLFAPYNDIFGML